jgi:hypothetical protein
MSEWSHLPNAAHIDRILDSVKANHIIWADAWNVTDNGAWHTAYNAARNAVDDAGRDTAWNTAWNAARNAAYAAAWDAARNAVDEAARNAAYAAAWDAARNATLALIAYDDSTKYLDMSLDQLQMLYALTDHPAALLLQPLVLAFSMERELA